MIHLHIPWSAVAVGAEVVGPNGELWTVSMRGPYVAYMRDAAGRESKQVTFAADDRALAVVAIREVSDVIMLLAARFPATRVLGEYDEIAGWVSPLDLDAEQLQAHLHAFHHELASEAPATSAVYGWHAELHRPAGGQFVGVGHVHR